MHMAKYPWYARLCLISYYWESEHRQVPRTLRVFLSHSVEGQPWQNEGEDNGITLDPSSLDFASGKGIPAWTFKVEGRLLDAVSVMVLSSFDHKHFFLLAKQQWPCTTCPTTEVLILSQRHGG